MFGVWTTVVCACFLCVYIELYIFHVCTQIYKCGAMSEYTSRVESGRVWVDVHHCILLLLSVPLGSPMFMRPIDRPTLLTASRRGGILSLMRSRPLASSKLLILCWGEKPRMAAETHTHTHTTTHDKCIHAIGSIIKRMFNRTLCIQTHAQ